MVFERAMEEALKAAKYDYLTGRRQRLSQIILDFIIDILTNFIDFILERLNIDFDYNLSGIDPQALLNIFLVIFIVMAAAATAIIIRLLNKRKAGQANASASIFDEFRKNTLSLPQIMELYNKYEKSGDLRQAVRYQYLALLVAVNGKKIVVIKDSTTGGQFVEEIRKNAPWLADGVAATVNMFNFLWFGSKTIAPEAFLLYKNTYNSLMAEVWYE